MDEYDVDVMREAINENRKLLGLPPQDNRIYRTMQDADEVEKLFFERNRYEEALRIIATGQRLRTMGNGKKKVMHYSSYDALQAIAKAALGYPERDDQQKDNHHGN